MEVRGHEVNDAVEKALSNAQHSAGDPGVVLGPRDVEARIAQTGESFEEGAEDAVELGVESGVITREKAEAAFAAAGTDYQTVVDRVTRWKNSRPADAPVDTISDDSSDEEFGMGVLLAMLAGLEGGDPFGGDIDGDDDLDDDLDEEEIDDLRS